MPEYFERPEVPGQKYFHCEPLRATLSVSSCASRWRGANHGAHRWNALLPQGSCIDKSGHCSGCRLGAAHAGERIVAVSIIQAHRVCSRCLRPSSRLIHDVKCVSCFNRELEVLKGRNAKGKPPSKHPPLGDVRVLYRDADGGVSAHVADHFTNATEAAVAIVHKHGKAVMFGFSGGFQHTWGDGGKSG